MSRLQCIGIEPIFYTWILTIFKHCFVLPTGLEPVISAVKGRRPNQLDDGSMFEQFDVECTVHWRMIWSVSILSLLDSVFSGATPNPQVPTQMLWSLGQIQTSADLREIRKILLSTYRSEDRILLMKWTMQKGGVPYFVCKIDRFCKSGGVHWKFIKPLHIWRESSSDRMNIYFCACGELRYPDLVVNSHSLYLWATQANIIINRTYHHFIDNIALCASFTITNRS